MCHRTVGLSVPRQNGKSEITIVLILINTVFFGYRVRYTSYNSDSCIEISRRVEELIEGNGVLKTYFPVEERTKAKSGDYEIQAVDPMDKDKKLGRADFITRGGGKGRGATADVIFFDEAQEMTDAENAALSAATITLEHSQLLYFGTPPPIETAATSGAHSAKNRKGMARDFFKTLRRMCWDGSAMSTAWFEWGVSKLVSKTDVDAYYVANPSLGFRMGTGQSLTERSLSSKIMSDEQFAVEHLGYWMLQDKARAIDITRWRDLKFEGEYPVNKDTKIAVCFKGSHVSDRIDVALAYKTGDLPIYVEVNHSFDTTKEWSVDAVDEFMEFYRSRNCSSIIVDGRGVEALLVQLQADYYVWDTMDTRRRQGKILEASASDASAASSLIVGAVNERALAHGGDMLLETVVEDAGKRVSTGYTSGVGFRSLSGRQDVNYLETIGLAYYALRQDNDVSRRPDIQRANSGFNLGSESALGVETSLF